MAMAGADGSLIVEVGDLMPDGSVYAGIITGDDGYKYPIYTTKVSCNNRLSFNAYSKVSHKLPKGWDLPDSNELQLMIKNKDKGYLKGSFWEAAKGYLSKATHYDSKEPCSLLGKAMVEVVRATKNSSGKEDVWSCYEKQDDTFSIRFIRRGKKFTA